LSTHQAILITPRIVRFLFSQGYPEFNNEVGVH
jgi:hypothetical protein